MCRRLIALIILIAAFTGCTTPPRHIEFQATCEPLRTSARIIISR